MRRADGRNDLYAVLAVYTLAYGLMFLVTGLYYDDWVTYRGAHGSVDQLVREAGMPLRNYYFRLVDRTGIPGYRVVVFATHLAAALCLLAVLEKVTEIDRRTRVLLVVFFALFPVYSARILAVASWYSFTYALYFIGLWILSVYLDTGKSFLRIASLLVLFASFLTHSLLVFYATALIYIAYRRRSELKTPASLAGFALRHPDFLLLPLVSWAIKLLYFEPFGDYRAYNRVTLESAILGLSYLDNAFLGGFIEPIADSLRVPLPLIAAAAVATPVVAVLLEKSYGRSPDRSRGQAALFLISGVVFFVLAVFPYLAVGKIPSPLDWDSRHQLLIPLGASFIVVYGIRMLAGEKVQNWIFAFLIVMFAASHMRAWVAFQKDWYKQVSLVEALRSAPAVERGTQFTFDDRTTDLDANSRHYRAYEYTALLGAAFDDGKERVHERDGSHARAPDTAVVIRHGELQLTLPEIIRLRALESLNETEFRARIKSVVRLSVDRAGF